MKIGSLSWTRSSANIASYGEGDPPHPGRLWVTVLRGGWHQVEGKIVANKIPTFGFRIYREGQGEIADFRYTPKTKPRGERLPDRTVTRLVREHMEAR